ncbi:MAG: energy-coupling factor transporter transmembrane protein EcfT [Firmicutes bacterium]|nr:energy-coupling factor transporter transmembrane protein EcfT [Bacillota bacterium]
MQVDIRTKLLIVAIFSVLALTYQDPRALAVIFLLNILTLLAFRVSFNIFVSLKNFIFMYFVLMIIQSFFVRSGEPLIKLGGMYLLTTGGILYGLSIILRFLILAGSGLILVDHNAAELLLGLVKLRVPYEIVFMIQVGIRFIPVFIGELQNVFNTIQLRGVDLRKVYKRKVLRVYVSIFSPLLYSVWQKAEKLSILLELRGFRRFPTRSYYRDISMKKSDYVIICLALVITAALVYVCHKILTL